MCTDLDELFCQHSVFAGVRIGESHLNSTNKLGHNRDTPVSSFHQRLRDLPSASPIGPSDYGQLTLMYRPEMNELIGVAITKVIMPANADHPRILKVQFPVRPTNSVLPTHLYRKMEATTISKGAP